MRRDAGGGSWGARYGGMGGNCLVALTRVTQKVITPGL